ncbi:velvet factor-domain-containing protein [Naematelia encephala]|uniref:Velvet factor-domain-containing protein n=1 Tax=Naematelia encephala TaxID=71784 RepID=A0A1Y2ANI3_9TREE|nr:velvet factor-domain-containing protein [Naematelia encephala]
MLYYLPAFWPPIEPTHRLVYIPPATSSPTPGILSSDPFHSGTASPHCPPTPSDSTTSANSNCPMDAAVSSISVPPIVAKPHSHLATDHDCILSSYEMSMRQQPIQARMCGVGEKSDRRPVDPTPIIQLKVIDRNGEDVKSANISDRDDSKRKLRRPEPVQGMSFMQNPYYFLFACLVGGDEKEDELHVIEDGKTRFLTGTPVSSLYHLKDLDNSDAAFFVFPDLGVRKEGRYKLKLTLFEIVEQEVYYCTTMYTSTFSVYSAKKFPGMQSATDLSRSFAEQGLKIRVRKDPRKRNAKIKRKSSANDSEEDMAEFPKRPRHLSSELPAGPDHRQYGLGYPYPPDVYHQHPPNAYPRGAPMPPPPMPHDPYRYPQYAHPGPYPGQPFYQGGPGRPTSSGHHHSVPPPPGYYMYPPPPQHSYPPVQHRQHHGHPAPHHDPRAMQPNVPWPQQDRHSRGAPPLPLRSPGLAQSPPPLPSHSAHSHRPHDQIYSPKQQSRPSSSADTFRLPPISSTTRSSHESTRSNERGSIVLPIIAGSDPTTMRDQSSSRSSPVVPRAEEGSKGTSTDGSPRSLAGRGANKMGLGHLVD